MIYGFTVRFGFLIDIGIRSFGWMDGFFEGSFVDWASFEVSSMFLSTNWTFGRILLIFRTHFCKVVFTTFNAFRFVTKISTKNKVLVSDNNPFRRPVGCTMRCNGLDLQIGEAGGPMSRSV
ncbi:Uncharacterized protein FWK35_00027398 [Aphis craccivora]|uniref:Uncharacterized protein n=1 Tax=Aphis craccivora TaxID=307492 RepID=A0A6G0YYD6_APHCR|nr:Uncharacterized protein FWK35_00027398 [Aphis craccivora]